MQALHTGLRRLVQIVVLDLAELPVIGIQYLQKPIGVSMERKADVADRTGLLFLLDPVLDPELTELIPALQIGQHMHQIIIDMVGF